MKPTIKMWMSRLERISLSLPQLGNAFSGQYGKLRLTLCSMTLLTGLLFIMGVVGIFYLITITTMLIVPLIMIVPQFTCDLSDASDRFLVGMMSLMVACTVTFFICLVFSFTGIPNSILSSAATNLCYKAQAALHLTESSEVTISDHYMFLYECGGDNTNNRTHHDIINN